MSRFIPASDKQRPPQTLYHAIPGQPIGDYITASGNYGAEILPAERQKLGMSPDAHTPLVFAATTFGKALAFTIIKGEKLFNSSIESANAEIAVVCDRDTFMKRERDATIYAFKDTGFVRLTNLQNQSVSTQPVPFSATKEVVKIKSADDMMRAGLQIFSFKDDFMTVYKSDAATKLNQDNSLTELANMIKSGKVIWENHARGINPNAALAQQMGIKMKASPKPASLRP